jgi:hypothetical protein
MKAGQERDGGKCRRAQMLSYAFEINLTCTI